jgi:hypothetical protein
MNKMVSSFVLAFAVIGLIATFALFGRDYGSMPQLVPTHFGIDGNPDAWGQKSTLVLFPVMAAAFFGLFLFIATGVLERSALTPPALPLLVRVLAAETIWMFFFIEYGTLQTALGVQGGLGIGFFLCVGLVLVTALGLAVYAISWSRSSR